MQAIINYNDPRWRTIHIDFARIMEVVGHDKSGEVSIILTNDKEIKNLNRRYRNIDRPTNVLSFETGDSELLGDIFISFDTVLREAELENKTINDHTAHMIVHGIFHLMGYDHIDNIDATRMERLETKTLRKLGIKNPYSNFSLKKIIQIFSLVVFGALSAFGFAPFNLWWATIIGIGLAYWVMIYDLKTFENDRFWPSLFRIFPFTAAYAIGMFWWVVNSIYVVPELADKFAIWTAPAILGIGIFGGFIFAIPFIIIRCMRQNAAYRPFLFASIWTVILWLREWFLTGFPWNPIANISMPFSMLSNSMSVWGAIGLTFIIIGFTSSLTEVIRSRKNTITPLIIFTLLITMGFVLGYRNIKISGNKNYESMPTVRIVQPGKSAIEKATYSRDAAIALADENINNLMRLAHSDSAPIDLIIFPETTYPYMIVDDNLPLAKNLGIKTIIGATSYDRGHFYNSLLVANPDGKIEKIYKKSHLVPFGEYRPFGDLIPTPGQLTQGTGPEVIETKISGKDFYFLPAICYEIIFSDSLMPKGTNSTPQVIINITNDNWFGKTPGTYQHLDMVRRYAIESGMPIIRANYSGISAFIESDGSIQSYLDIGQAGSLDGMVDGSHMTIYRMIGRDLWMIIILIFSVICSVSISLFQRKD